MSTLPTPRANEDSAPRLKVPPLTRAEKVLAGFAALAAGGVSGLGLAASYGALSKAGADWGFDHPWMLPIGIDVAIPAFSVANLILIRMNMPLAWVRFVPWALTAVTCWLNVAAGQTLSAKIAHGTMPLLWVVFAEIMAHIYAVRIGQATGTRMEKARRSRWLVSPVSTLIIWRRMILWEITSYERALELERARQLVIADWKEEHGWWWRRKTPPRERVLLKLGALTPVVDEVRPVQDADVPTDPVFEEPVPASLMPASAFAAAVPAPRAQVTATIAPDAPASAQAAEREPVSAVPDAGDGHVDRPASGETSQPMTEEELYLKVKEALRAGLTDLFAPGGSLSGGAMGRALGQTPGNGRKVRRRLLSRYAAETGIQVSDEFNVEDLVTTSGTSTAP